MEEPRCISKNEPNAIFLPQAHRGSLQVTGLSGGRQRLNDGPETVVAQPTAPFARRGHPSGKGISFPLSGSMWLKFRADGKEQSNGFCAVNVSQTRFPVSGGALILGVEIPQETREVHPLGNLWMAQTFIANGSRPGFLSLDHPAFTYTFTLTASTLLSGA